MVAVVAQMAAAVCVCVRGGGGLGGWVVVPAVVIQRGPQGAFVFVIKDDQTIEVRPVKVVPGMPAQVEQGEVVIESGLRPGERVVLAGPYKLQQGTRVKIADETGKSEGRGPKAEGKPKAENRGPKAKVNP